MELDLHEDSDPASFLKPGESTFHDGPLSSLEIPMDQLLRLAVDFKPLTVTGKMYRGESRLFGLYIEGRETVALVGYRSAKGPGVVSSLGLQAIYHWRDGDREGDVDRPQDSPQTPRLSHDLKEHLVKVLCSLGTVFGLILED